MKRFKSIAAAAFAVGVIAAYVLPALPTGAQSSSSLSITPKKNYLIEPGETVNDDLTIRNLDSNTPLSLTLRVIDFTYTGQGGTPKLFLGENAPQTTWSLKPYLTVPQNVTVQPGESKTINMNVSIPANLGAGSYYSAIVYSSGSGGNNNSNNVGLSASGVTLAFVSVPGDVRENLTLEKFGAYFPAASDSDASYSFITTQEPQNMAYTLKNSGNVTESPSGSITLNNMFGKEYTITEVNPNGSLALIGQTRTFTSCIKLKSQEVDFSGEETEANTCVSPGLWPGRYSAELDLYYGRNGNVTKNVTGTAVFWYLPIWFVTAVLIALLVIAYFARRMYLAVKEKMTGGVKFNKKPSRKRRR